MRVNVDKKSGDIDKRSGYIDKQNGNIDKRSGNIDKRCGDINKYSGDIDKRNGDINSRSHGSRADYYMSMAVIICFCAVIFGLTLANVLLPDKEISYSERRKLAKAPAYSGEELLSGELFEDYEKYFLDQFVMRDSFRSLKALASFNILMQKDNSGIYIADGYINKLEYPLNEKAILNAAYKLNEVYDKYLQGMKVHYAIIPDKNYYIAADNGYPAMDYEQLAELMEQKVRHMDYIDLFGELDITDYYTSDIHWSQDKLIDVADMLLERMGNEAYAMDVEYSTEALHPFYGSYYGQAALPLKPDTLVYLSNDIIESAEVYDHIDKSKSRVYMTDKFGTADSYDMFLSGPKSMLTISRAEAETGRELIIFRDSFGSSIAPLLLKGYDKITLIDLRYMATKLLGDYIEFADQDVLFLYNTIILNNSYMLK